MQFWSLSGAKPYEDLRRLQLELVEARAKGLIGDTVLFLEHEPTITRGRGLQRKDPAQAEHRAQGDAREDTERTPADPQRERHMPLTQALPAGIAFCESERGGDLTYHGPGQLVIYPIVKVEDIEAHIRKMEAALSRVLAQIGIVSRSRRNATGVWIGDKKLASIGIAVKKWVSYHGMAINVVNDLKPFFLISPCGFAPEVMTRLADLWPDLPQKDWRFWLESRFAEEFSGLKAPVIYSGAPDLKSITPQHFESLSL